MINRFLVAVLNLLVTAISIGVALPGFYEEDFRIMTLTFLVLFMSKLVSSINGYDKEMNSCFKVLILVECFVDVIAIAFCFHYLFVILNIDVKTIPVDSYSVFSGKFYFYLIIVVSAVHVLFDLFRCGILFLKSYRTNRIILNLIK